MYKFEEVSKISKDYAVHGQKLLCELRAASKPLKFVYMSGVAGERDQSKRPWLMGKHVLMRVCLKFTSLHPTSKLSNSVTDVCVLYREKQRIKS